MTPTMRLGGDEFAVLLTGTATVTPHEYAGRIRDARWNGASP
jgi:GGDEF domain-containing protein